MLPIVMLDNDYGGISPLPVVSEIDDAVADVVPAIIMSDSLLKVLVLINTAMWILYLLGEM